MQATSSHVSTGNIYGRWLLAAIVLSSVAAATHVFAAPEHFEEWVGYGAFFVVAAAAQQIYAILLLFRGPGLWLLWAGIIGNGLIIGLYAITRTVGVPFFGPEASEVETIGLIDAVSKAVEMGLIVCLVQLARIRRATHRIA